MVQATFAGCAVTNPEHRRRTAPTDGGRHTGERSGLASRRPGGGSVADTGRVLRPTEQTARAWTCLLVAALAAGMAACGGSTPVADAPDPTAALPSSTAASTPTSSPCGSSATPPATYRHIVVVMNENQTWDDVGGIGFTDPAMPYLHSLARQCTTFTDWTETNTGQNSLTQYIGLTSGADNPRTVDDCSPSTSCTSTDDNIFRQVRISGGTPRSFVEGATTGCSAAGNVAKHVPAMYYTGGYTDAAGVARNDHDFCDAEVRPLTELDVDHLPTFAMITPSLCNDGHDCANDKVDAFARTWVSKILQSPGYAAGDTAVMVLYDEDHPVPNLIIAPTATPGPNTTPGAGHTAMLKTWDEMLGLPLIQQRAIDQAISLRAPAHI